MVCQFKSSHLETHTKTSFSNVTSKMSTQIFPSQSPNFTIPSKLPLFSLTTNLNSTSYCLNKQFVAVLPISSVPQPSLSPLYYCPRAENQQNEFSINETFINPKLKANRYSNQTKATMVTYYPNRIFVGSLSRMTSATELADSFEQFGFVTEAKIISDSNGHSKGYGFVTFDSSETVEIVLKSGPLFLNSKRIAIASAMKKQHHDEQWIL